MSRRLCPYCDRTLQSIVQTTEGVFLGTTVIYFHHDDGETHWTAIVDTDDCPDEDEESIVNP